MTKIRRNLPNNQYLAALLANSPSTSNVFATIADLAALGTAVTSASKLQHDVKYAQQINKGQAVYVSGADGTNMLVSKADNSTESTSSKTIGLVLATGTTNYQGKVITEGLLAGLDTSLATSGDAVWLGTNGNLIFWHYGLTTKPVAPAHLVFIGIVTRVNANNGEIFVKVQNGFELDELHDVSLPSYIDKGVLYRDTTTNLWKTDSIANLLGQATTTTLGYLSSADWSLFNSKQPALSGGVANRTVVWDSASTLRNGAIIDTGTFVSINMATTNNAILEVDGGNGGTQGGIYSQGNLYGVKGYSYNGSGVFGNSSGGIGVRGESAGTLPSNIGVSGSAIALIVPGSPVSLENIGGKFYAEGANVNYAIQLIDGTEGVGKFLKSATSSGKANWSTISSSDVTTALGYTPANITGATFTGDIAATNLLGINTGDETITTIKTKLGAASGSQDGYLTLIDWNAFSNKLSGTGTANKLTKWSSSGVTDSNISDDGAGNITITSATSDLRIFLKAPAGGVANVITFLKNNINAFVIGVDSTSNYIINSYNSSSGAFLGNALTVAANTLNVTLGSLAGSGTRMVTVDAAGLLSTQSISSGSVTSVTGTAPILSSGGATPAISIPKATTSIDGYLSAIDWTTFNAKQNAITLTTTGTSGAATFDGTTLNIPQYAGGSVASGFDYGQAYAANTMTFLM
jgi:hypothetical protein